MSLRYICWVYFLFYLGLHVSSCGDRNTTHMDDDDDKINLDQDVTHRLRPLDSIFLDFDKNWTKFINRTEVLRRPVRIPKQPEVWEPVIISDCVFSQEAGGAVAQVEISWNEQPVERPVRFDLSLHYQGFERNYYTTIYPVKEEERFNLPENSQFISDTAAVLLTGPSMFPKVVAFNTQSLQGQDPSQQQVQGGRDITRYTLRLRDMGPGLSYRIRMCTFNQEVWTPTSETIFTTPICPTDNK